MQVSGPRRGRDVHDGDRRPGAALGGASATSHAVATFQAVRPRLAAALVVARRGMASSAAAGGKKPLSRASLNKLSHSQLVDLLCEEGDCAEADSPMEDAPPSKKQKQEAKPKRAFDMSKHSQRHIALRVAYIGTAYQGFAYQSESGNVAPTGTVEGMLMQALMKTCLITDRDACGVSCGGRTDKGVSALGQVVALRVRSNLSEGVGVVPPAAAAAAAAAADDASPPAPPPKEEIDYCRVLNRCLPDDIRVLAWRPTDSEFSARFSASGRTYKYFFQRADLDVDAMRAAASRLIGEHDLRNFCKIDPNVSNFRRTILSFEVAPVGGFAGSASDGGMEEAQAPHHHHPEALWEFTVHGTAFLYHQVRCMVAVLFLVGERKESPEIVTELLDLERYPRRPNYDLASEAPLLLYRIHYNGVIDDWSADASAAHGIAELWAEQQRQLMLRSAMVHTMRADVRPLPEAAGPGEARSKGGKGHGARNGRRRRASSIGQRAGK